MKKILLLFIIICFKQINGQIISTIAGNGTFGYSGDGGLATSAKINIPYAVAVDDSGNVYIGDYGNNLIRKVTASTGIINTIAGSSNTALGDGGLATSAQLGEIYGVAVDKAGNVYIAGHNSNRIRKVTAITGIITTIAGNGTAGYSGDGGLSTASILNTPQGVAVDSAGNIYISDTGNDRVRMINASTGIIDTYAGNGSCCGATADGVIATTTRVIAPYGVAVDNLGNLYIVSNRRIRKVTANGGIIDGTSIITTVAGNGTNGNTGDGGLATAAKLSLPTGITVDRACNLYIADEGNNRVRKVAASSGIISQFAGNGGSGYSGDGGLATSAQFDLIWGIASDTLGNIYIPDANNERIRKVTVSITTEISEAQNDSELITMFPNPTNNSFVIKANSIEKQNLQIVDINGRLVFSQNLISVATIDVSNLNEGVYFVSLKSNKGIANKRLIIIK